jgi:hypothetical protein
MSLQAGVVCGQSLTLQDDLGQSHHCIFAWHLALDWLIGMEWDGIACGKGYGISDVERGMTLRSHDIVIYSV